MQRKNAHQTHMESLVLLGSEGLMELTDKFEGLIDEIEKGNKRLNTTIKIDGSPAVTMWSHYEGYPDNSISLKSFITGSNDNSMSSDEDIETKYSGRQDMIDKLKWCLKLAKCIPSGEAWQGDCLYTSLKEQNINGTDYLVFHPNKIVYAVSEHNKSYEQIKNSKFGICMHTIYTGLSKSQSFNVDLSRLHNVPDDIYVMSPAIDIKQATFDTAAIDNLYSVFLSSSKKLLKNNRYDDLCSNKLFMQYWNTFENSRLSDRQTVTLDREGFYEDLKGYIAEKSKQAFDKRISILKTDAGKEKATNQFNQESTQLEQIIEQNKDLLYDIVDCFNLAAKLKMDLLKGFKELKQDYDTYLLSRSSGYIPTGPEGISVSDQDGNIVKLVDRSTFSHANRSDDFISGFEHNESLEEDMNNKIAVIGFGRLNPPTIGHKALVDKIKQVANEVGGEPRLYLSHSYDGKKNPLPYESKLQYTKDAFGNVIKESNAKSLIDVFKELNTEGFNSVIYVGGSDRIGGDEDVTSRVLKYNGQPDKSGNVLYNFDSIKFVSAGQRDEDSDDLISKASASLARKYVKENNFESFKEIVPFDETTAKKIFDEVKLNLNEGFYINEDDFGETLIESFYSSADVNKYRKGRDHHYIRQSMEDFFSFGLKDRNDINHTYVPDNVQPQEVRDLIVNADDKAKAAAEYLISLDYKTFLDAYKNITGIKWQDTVKHSSRDMRKAFEAEDSITNSADMIDTFIKAPDVLEYFANKYSKEVNNNQFVKAENVGSANSARGLNIINLFTDKDKFKNVESGPSTSDKIADVIYDVKINFEDGTFEEDKIFISNKDSDDASVINLGLGGLSGKQIADLVLNSYSSKELELINAIINLNGHQNTDTVIADNGKNTYNKFYYKFKDPNIENIFTAIVNGWGNNYFYSRSDIKDIKYVNKIIDKIRSSEISQIEVVGTQTTLYINAICGDMLYKMSFRRKGSSSIGFQMRTMHKTTLPNFTGTQLEDISNYNFYIESKIGS